MTGGQSSIVIRPYREEDRDAVLALAPRLTEGVAAWRDPERPHHPGRGHSPATRQMEEHHRL